MRVAAALMLGAVGGVLTATPAPAVRYHCDTKSYKCDAGPTGHSSLAKCEAACVAPVGKQMVTFHVLDPAFTGVRNKNTGDFAGDFDYIMETFDGQAHPGHEGINYTLLEQVLVEIAGDFGRYSMCNVGPSPRSCDDDAYTCEGASAAAGHETRPPNGNWYSFPKQGEGKSPGWRQLAVQRRIKSSCLAEAWRAEAGGCPNCGAKLDRCVQSCIQRLGKDQLKKVWDAVLQPQKTSGPWCPDEPMPCGGTPSPQTATRYQCDNATATCVLDWDGYATQGECEAGCQMAYVCSSHKCNAIGVSPEGVDLNTCNAVCSPAGPTPAPQPAPPAPATPAPAPPTPPPTPDVLYLCAYSKCSPSADGVSLPICTANCA